MESTGAKVAIGVIAVISVVIITAVIIMDPGTAKEENNTLVNNTTATNETSSEEKNVDYMANAEKQMAEPENGETIAVMHVKDYGDITVKFFSSVAPKAVENFVTHAKEGYYDGVTFHRIMKDFMIQSGDPQGTGAGGQSIWGTGFEEELSDTLVPYRGSLCMASAGVGTSSLGSQFFITQAKYSKDKEEEFRLQGISEDLLKAYKKYGGYMTLNGNYTVFGQVIDGMDVVDKIAKTKVKANALGEKSVPTKKIIIKNIEVKTYQK